jgi:hypothetical protein
MIQQLTNIAQLLKSLPFDNILPVVENVVISEDGYSVAGQTEPKSTIKIVDADGDLRGEYQVDETGYFNLSVYPQILRGEQSFITATDLAKREQPIQH